MRDRRASIVAVIGAVAQITGVDFADIVGRSTMAGAVGARVIATGCIRELLNPTPGWTEVARVLGRAEHTAEIHRYRRWLEIPAADRRRWLIRTSVLSSLRDPARAACVTADALGLLMRGVAAMDLNDDRAVLRWRRHARRLLASLRPFPITSPSLDAGGSGPRGSEVRRR